MLETENHNQLRQKKIRINKRFDGFLPIVIDLETGGANDATDALLEIAAFLIDYDMQAELTVGQLFHRHVLPFTGSHLNPRSLEINGITDPFHPFRYAVQEKEALLDLFAFTREALKKHHCRRAILVGHNAHFDLGFLHAAATRCGLQKENPYHNYTVFDTATLSGAFLRKTVLSKAVLASGLSFDHAQAHSAIYDANITAELFCLLLNRLKV